MNFDSKDEGQWFYFDNTNHHFGGVKLRLLTPEEEDLIEEATTTVVRKPIRGLMTDDRKVNTKEKNDMCYRRWIVDWSDISLDGKNLQCNDANKITMMKVTKFARFVIDKIVDLGDVDTIAREARLKNLKTTSDGDMVDSDVKGA